MKGVREKGGGFYAVSVVEIVMGGFESE